MTRSQVAIKEETVAQEDLEGELTCEVCELTFEGILEMEQHSATHFVDNKNVSVPHICVWPSVIMSLELFILQKYTHILVMCTSAV